jgi:hypothetical protein
MQAAPHTGRYALDRAHTRGLHGLRSTAKGEPTFGRVSKHQRARAINARSAFAASKLRHERELPIQLSNKRGPARDQAE